MKFPDIQLGKAIEHKDWRSFYEGLYTPEAKAIFIEVLDSRRGAPKAEIDLLMDRADKLGKVNHPNISRMLAFGENDGFYYLALEKESDMRLADHLTNGEYLPPLEATRLVLDMASGLQAVHKLGVIHGELRPSNVLFNDHGQVKLRNVFRYRPNKEALLEMLTRRPHYATPDHIRMEVLDYRSDHYALGVMYFQLLTGRPPYEAKNVKDIWKMHLEGDIPTLPRDLAEIDGLEDVVRTMLAKRPKFRHKDDEALISALEEIEDLLMMMEGEDFPTPTFSPSASQSRSAENTVDYSSAKSTKSKPRLENPRSSRSVEPRASASQSRSGSATSSKSSSPGKLAPKSRTTTGSRSSSPKSSKSHSTRTQGPRGWKKGQGVEPSHVRRQEIPKESSYLTWAISAGAVVVIAGIIVFWINRGIEPEGPSDSQSRSSSGPKMIIRTAKEMAAAKAGLLNENGSLKQVPSQNQVPSRPTSSVVSTSNAISNPTLARSEPEVIDLRTPEEKSRDAKVELIKTLAQKPSNIAIPQIEAFLEDEDTKVRLIANQIYRDLKGGSLLSQADLRSDWAQIEATAAINGDDVEKTLNSLQNLANSKDPQSVAILKGAMSHKDERVRRMGLQLMLVRKDPEYVSTLVDQFQKYPWDREISKMAMSLKDADLIPLRSFCEKGDARNAILLVPFWAKRGDSGRALLVDLMKSRMEMAFPIALELAALGEPGRDALLQVLWDQPQDKLVNFILSALRESKLDDGSLMRLEMLYGKFSIENNQYLAAILSNRNRPLDKDESTTEMKALIGMDDMSKNPTSIELENLVKLMGSGSREMDLRILDVLADKGDIAVPYLKKVISERTPLDIKRMAVEALFKNSSDAAIQALIEIASDSQSRGELTKDVKVALAKLGSNVLPILVSSKSISVKDKIELALPIKSESANMAIIDILKKAEGIESSKGLQVLLDAYPIGQELFDPLLQEHRDLSFLKSLLKGLGRLGGKGGIAGTSFLLNHEDPIVRSEAFNSLKQRLQGDREEWYHSLNVVTDNKIKAMIISYMKLENPKFSLMIKENIGSPDKNLRAAVIDKIQLDKQLYTDPDVINRLVLEDVTSLRSDLVKLLLDTDNPSPIAVLWGVENLAGTAKKKLLLKLAEISTSKDQIASLQNALLIRYNFQIKSLIVKFLASQGQDVLTPIAGQLSENDPNSIKLFRDAAQLMGNKATTVLIKMLDQAKSAFLRDEIELGLKQLNVKYKLDSKTGRYIVQ